MTGLLEAAGGDAAVVETARDALDIARRAGAAWAMVDVSERVRVIGRLRRRLGDAPLSLARTADTPWRSSAAETLTAEVLPLLDACRFLEVEAPRLLAPRRPDRRGRPVWLLGSTLEVRRDPLGVVLVIGTANYPILLAGVQVLQALIAGNAVLVKPGHGGGEAMRSLAGALAASGLPAGLLHVLPEAVEAATASIEQGVDKVVLTGAHETGARVLGQLARTVTPSVMELSGCDAAVVLADADLRLAARAIAFGMTLNGGFTCIAPRRLLVADSVIETFVAELTRALAARPALRLPAATRDDLARAVDGALAAGGRLVAGDLAARDEGRSDAGSPIVLAEVPEAVALELAAVPAPAATLFAFRSEDQVVARVARCRFRLGVSVFGPARSATALARRMDAGVAVVNDVIVPTADPRVPFGGRGASGFGVTRGAEGLLEMTAIQAVIVRAGRFRPHYDPVDDRDTPLFEAFVRLLHGSSLGRRIGALRRLIAAGRARQRRRR